MLNKKRIADSVAAGGMCLLIVAAVDGAIELFETVTSVNLWFTCGIIGMALLAVVHVLLGGLDRNSPLRRGLRHVMVWKKLRQRRKTAARRPSTVTDDALVAAR